MLPGAGQGVLQGLVEGIQAIAARGGGLPYGARLHSQGRALASGVSAPRAPPRAPHSAAPSRENPDEQDYTHRRLILESRTAACSPARTLISASRRAISRCNSPDITPSRNTA